MAARAPVCRTGTSGKAAWLWASSYTSLMAPRMEEVLRHASRLRDRYERTVKNVPYEAMGVQNSEVLFLLAALGDHIPTQVLESGRARGQSTLLLGLCFPDVPVRSVEFDRDSPNEEVAARRLADLPDVELLFGDSREILRRILKPGDVVVIDGPKGWRAIKLALRLLATGHPAFVFMHDCSEHSEERRFFERHLPAAIYSDHPDWISAHGDLDPLRYRSGSFGTYACLAFDSGTAYSRILRRAAIESFIRRTLSSIRKRTLCLTVGLRRAMR